MAHRFSSIRLADFGFPAALAVGTAYSDPPRTGDAQKNTHRRDAGGYRRLHQEHLESGSGCQGCLGMLDFTPHKDER